MLRALQFSLVVSLLSSGCVSGMYRPCPNRSRSVIIDSLRMHYCAEGDWPRNLDQFVDSLNSTREQRQGLLFDAGLDRLVLMQAGNQRDTHLVTLLRRPICDGPRGHAEEDDSVTWVSFAIPKEFSRISSSESNGLDNASTAVRGEKLFELPGKHAVMIANLYGDQFSVSELEQLKISYEKTFPRVFRNVEWARRELELQKGLPRTLLIFTADRLEEKLDISEDRWVFVTLAILAGKRLFALEAAAPLSEQETLEKLVELVTASLEFERPDSY